MHWLKQWEWLLQQPAGTPSPLPPFAANLPTEVPKHMANNPDWTAIAVFVTGGIFVLTAVGAVVKHGATYLRNMDVSIASILIEVKNIAASAAHSEKRIEAIGDEVHEIKGQVHGLDRRVNVLENKD